MTNVGSSVSHPLLKAEKKARVAPSGVDLGSVGAGVGVAVAVVTVEGKRVESGLFVLEPVEPRTMTAATTTADTATATAATNGKRYLSFIGYVLAAADPTRVSEIVVGRPATLSSWI